MLDLRYAIYEMSVISFSSKFRTYFRGCDIDNIDLCSQMINLKILSLSMNRVKCLKPLENCIQLEELYLRKNEISSLSELEHLRDLKLLKILWIDENPCTADNKHRAKVLRILPHLACLDDKPVTIDELVNATETSRQDDQRTVIDKIIPNHSRVQELISNNLINNPEHIHQQQPPKLMITSMYEGSVEMGNDNNRNLWQNFK
uniref:LRRcap domain-containing protein n=1 Tax=Elaeophora elaphi TaxID=1147741 RepID=A0A0R3S3G2_9BILA